MRILVKKNFRAGARTGKSSGKVEVKKETVKRETATEQYIEH